ncbi:galactose mutarotase [Dysgonomonas sp. 216]|uniref:aldose epimerase family protein n=1 Tax=Dysgonomonas sp. 216 TaxID=2302934 RepID=UPI0013D41F94|nr:aldose epimerase family protein [Dysgonomonas sp. 216]NDW19775.1 galactose mutarotase [Dysgonomonas sp. 216]
MNFEKPQKTKSGLNPQDFNAEVDGKKVELFVLVNKSGAEITVTNYGAKVVSLMVPDKSGKLVDVVLGHDTIAEYLKSEEPYFGAVCGRTANRIANGKFTLEGKEYTLAVNNGPNNLHGGIKGFNSVVWDAKQTDAQTVELTYLSVDGEEGFPGNLSTKIIYKLTDDNALDIAYEATTDKTTIINLTNHSYFNLSGAGDPSIADHVLKMYADEFLPADETSIPYGKPEKVVGTPMDFTTPHEIGERINEDFEPLIFGRGYDHTFIMNKKEGDLALTCYSPKTGIVLDTYTTEPGVQVYTGNWMTGNFVAKQGQRYPAQSAVCFETQHYPDSINKPDYPTVILKPGEKFESKTIYKFSTKK